MSEDMQFPPDRDDGGVRQVRRVDIGQGGVGRVVRAPVRRPGLLRHNGERERRPGLRGPGIEEEGCRGGGERHTARPGGRRPRRRRGEHRKIQEPVRRRRRGGGDPRDRRPRHGGEEPRRAHDGGDGHRAGGDQPRHGHHTELEIRRGHDRRTLTGGRHRERRGAPGDHAARGPRGRGEQLEQARRIERQHRRRGGDLHGRRRGGGRDRVDGDERRLHVGRSSDLPDVARGGIEDILIGGVLQGLRGYI